MNNSIIKRDEAYQKDIQSVTRKQIFNAKNGRNEKTNLSIQTTIYTKIDIKFKCTTHFYNSKRCV